MFTMQKGGHFGRGSIPVSTVLRKSVRFFIINIFLAKSFQVEIWKMVWTVSKYPV